MDRVYRSVEIYTFGSPEENTHKLIKNPPLVRLPIPSVSLSVEEESDMFSPTAIINYICESKLEHKIWKMDPFFLKLNNQFGFVPQSIINDYNGSFISNESRKYVLFDALINEKIPHYVVASLIKLDEHAGVQDTFIQGYGTKCGLIKNLDLMK